VLFLPPFSSALYLRKIAHAEKIFTAVLAKLKSLNLLCTALEVGRDKWKTKVVTHFHHTGGSQALFSQF